MNNFAKIFINALVYFNFHIHQIIKKLNDAKKYTLSNTRSLFYLKHKFLLEFSFINI